MDEGEDVQSDSPPKFVEEIDVSELQVIQVKQCFMKCYDMFPQAAQI